jgi:hypothetical protein
MEGLTILIIRFFQESIDASRTETGSAGSVGAFKECADPDPALPSPCSFIT